MSSTYSSWLLSAVLIFSLFIVVVVLVHYAIKSTSVYSITGSFIWTSANASPGRVTKWDWLLTMNLKWITSVTEPALASCFWGWSLTELSLKSGSESGSLMIYCFNWSSINQWLWMWSHSQTQTKLVVTPSLTASLMYSREQNDWLTLSR